MATSLKQQDILVYKLLHLPWLLILVAFTLTSLGALSLYSANGGDMYPWAKAHLMRMGAFFFASLIIALLSEKFLRFMSYPAYVMCILALIAVLLFGTEGGLGAQRWLNIAGFQFQPSETMKVGLVMALAAYFHTVHAASMRQFKILILPLCLIAVPAALVLQQPNLGMATILILIGISVAYMAGVGWKKFLLAAGIAAVALPVLWMNLHQYQKQRVLTFLNPDSDPLGTGYNSIQSQIAIGSGGVTGRGFLNGTQTQLQFLPEKHTDFIFALYAEEWGLIGCIVLLALYLLLFLLGLRIAVRARKLYHKLLAWGCVMMLFTHSFINIGMVVGLLPVVGVPLPFMSYGGSSLLSSYIAIGLLMHVHLISLKRS